MSQAPFRQRLLITLSSSTRFASGILMGTAMGFYIGSNGGSRLAVSLVQAAYFGGLMLFSPAWGTIADTTGRRRAVLVATGLGATAAILPLAVVDGVWIPIGFRALYAAFAAGFPPIMLTIVNEYGDDDHRGQSIGFYNSTRSFGFSAGQLSAGILLGLFVPMSLYLAVAAISLASAIAVVFVADTAPKPARGTVTLGTIAAEFRRRLLPTEEDREQLKRNGLSWLYVALVLRNMCVLGTISLMPIYLPQQLGFTEFQMGFVLALNPGTQVAFMYAFGKLADDMGRKPLITAGMVASGVFALLVALADMPQGQLPRLGLAAAAFTVIAAAYSSMAVGALSFIGDVAPPERESELMGLRSTAKGAGGVFGPALIGGLASLTTYTTAFIGGSVLAFVAAGLSAIALVESKGGPIPQGGATPGDD